jgi:hypothetical protein
MLVQVFAQYPRKKLQKTCIEIQKHIKEISKFIKKPNQREK